MKQEKTITPVATHSFFFESYGVIVAVSSDNEELLEHAKNAAQKALVGEFSIVESRETPHRFGVRTDGKLYFLSKDGEENEHGESLKYFLKYFCSMIRITIAEYAVNCVFMHAGVVGWRGMAIVMPANSFKGKTTLVAELVRNGAVYYSDDYAVFDSDGFVHPFARLLSIRNGGWERERIDVTEVSAESLGGSVGSRPMEVGLFLLTEYSEDAAWEPELLTPGNGIIEMVSQTIPIRYNPKFALNVLKKATANAIIAKGVRSDAKIFVHQLLDFIDNKLSSYRILNT